MVPTTSGYYCRNEMNLHEKYFISIGLALPTVSSTEEVLRECESVSSFFDHYYDLHRSTWVRPSALVKSEEIVFPPSPPRVTQARM